MQKPLSFIKTPEGAIGRETYDRRVSNAKRQYKENFIAEHGFLYCEVCGKNQQGCPGIAASHTVSVKYAIEIGRAEIGYDLLDLRLAGQKCHLGFESRFSNQEKLEIYEKRTTI